MITVQESIPIKLSGQSSFLVSFPYNKDLVDTVKLFTPAI